MSEYPKGWGDGFPASHDSIHESSKGTEFSWHVAGYRGIGDSERTDLEKEPDRVLTDHELQNADYIVVYMSGVGYKTFTGGPWDDWPDLWADMEAFYDEY